MKKVAEAQSKQTANTKHQTPNTNQTGANTTTPKLSNLSTDGKAWFIHPIALFNFVSLDLIDVESFLTKYESEHKNFKANEKDVVSDFNQKSKDSLRGIIKRINLFYKEHEEFKPNIYYVSYMLATARWEATWGRDFFCALEERSGSLGKAYFNKYDPVLASNESLKKRAKNNGNTEEGDGYKYRGRGLVHLTWKNNYKKASDYFGIDFVDQPDKAAELDYAVPIMIWGMMKGIFTGGKLPRYIYKSHIDYKAARAVINKNDSADNIAFFARQFESILRATSNLTEEF
ncbi:hypothetical protein [Gilliamella intestini]|uniref:Chitinase class I n=1 Tax=Gilliamella intestini TaxID=1798183 RepID=A0A1C4CVQ6_9GAMM|nr:hypothetical protein [Gilliamella intestini]SCC23195.1 Chitinase class I [Gilliamella intestini]